MLPRITSKGTELIKRITGKPSAAVISEVRELMVPLLINAEADHIEHMSRFTDQVNQCKKDYVKLFGPVYDIDKSKVPDIPSLSKKIREDFDRLNSICENLRKIANNTEEEYQVILDMYGINLKNK